MTADRPYAEIGERVRLAIKFLGMGQGEFADHIGHARPPVSRWVNGVDRISLKGALAIRQETGFTMDWLYFGDEATLPHRLVMWLRENSDDSA